MAFNSEIKGYMTFGKSFSRGSAFPLEAYEIWTDYDALVAYAANTDPNKDPSYIGQKVAYVDVASNKVTHYGIEVDGSLKELGATPIGDEKSIVVDETDYTISLKGVDGLVFERDVVDEDGKPTGKKEEVKFQPLMTKDGLVWVEPSKTTVEGLATLLSELTVRVKALENDRVTEQELADAIAGVEAKIEAVDFVDNDELAAAIKVETDRAEAAEKALGERIEAIDFVDANELATALEPYAKTADVNTELAKKADKSAYDQTVLDLDALEAKVDAFLSGSGATDAIDSLQELITYINEHDDADIAGIMKDIQALEQKLTLGTYVDGEETKEYATVKAYVEAVIEALNLTQYAKASDLSDLSGRVDEVDGKFASYTNTEALTGLLAGKQDVIPENTYDAYGAAAAAREGAVADVAAVGYALTADVVDNDTFEEFKTANSKAITEAVAAHETAVAGTYATKQALADHESAADGKYATKEFVGAFTTGEDSYKDITTVIGYVNKKAEETLAAAQGGSSETAASVKLQLDNYKTENDAKVQKNTNDIAALQGQLGTTNTNVSSNTTEIGKINEDISVNIKPAIEALEDADTVITGTLTGHTAAIKTINETTIPALQGVVNTKAAQSDVDAINAKIGTVEEGKTVVDMINAVAGKIDFSPYAKKDEVAATYATIAALEGIYKAGEGEAEATGILAEEIARAKAAEKKLSDDLAILINNPTEELDSVVEIIEHVKNNGAAVTGIITRLNGHDAILAGIGGEGETATVKKYVDDAIAAIPGLAIATSTTLGGIKSAADVVDGETTTTAVNKVYVDATTGVAEVKAFSIDNLVQGSMTLVLNAGDVDVI